MEIVLSQKDADFILSYLRSDLQRISYNCERVNKNECKLDSLKEKIEKSDSIMKKLVLKAFEQNIREDAAEYRRLYKERTDKLVKCIELLTVGSNNA